MRKIIEVIAFIADIIKLFISAVIMGVRKLFGLKTSWKAWFMEYVPANVSAYTLLWVMDMLGVKGVYKKSREGHLDKNRTVWQGLKDKCCDGRYIEVQSLLKELVYGRHTGDYNSCEVIAVYNALRYLAAFSGQKNVTEYDIDFPELLEIFERKGICAGGSFGTSPEALYRFFRKKGYSAWLLVGRELTASRIAEFAETCDTFIMTAYNDRDDLMAMVHTVSITVENDGYVVHNGCSGGNTYSSLEEVIREYRKGHGKAICLIGIASQNPISLL